MATVTLKIADPRVSYAELQQWPDDGRQYELDGISVEYPDWHFNVRPSNTEPLLRLNLEATSEKLMEQKRDEVVALIRS